MCSIGNAVDGIVFDRRRQPDRVPRAQAASRRQRVALHRDYDRLPADAVIHWFRTDRPGQARGIPDITPALPLFAQLRRFTLAVLAAAETAADFAGILYTDAPANGEADAAEPFEPIELEQRALLDDARRLEDEPDAGGATGDHLRRVQARDPQRDRPLPEHAVQRRGRQFVGLQLRLRATRSSDLLQVDSRRASPSRNGRARSHPRRLARRSRAHSRSPTAGSRSHRRLDASVVLGRPRARRSRQGSQRPGNATGQSHDDAGRRIRTTRAATGKRNCDSEPRKWS